MLVREVGGGRAVFSKGDFLKALVELSKDDWRHCMDFARARQAEEDEVESSGLSEEEDVTAEFINNYVLEDFLTLGGQTSCGW